MNKISPLSELMPLCFMPFPVGCFNLLFLLLLSELLLTEFVDALAAAAGGSGPTDTTALGSEPQKFFTIFCLC